MSFMLSWKREDGVSGSETFESEQGATTAAQSIKGVAMVSQLPTGPYSVFRDGQQLAGDDAVAAVDELSNEPHG